MSVSTPANQVDEKSTLNSMNDPHRLLYERSGDTLHFKVTGITNHEMADILIGIIARMDTDDRADFYEELIHYAEMLHAPDQFPDRHLSPVSAGIAQRPDLLKENRRSRKRR